MLKAVAKQILPPFLYTMLRRIAGRGNRPYHPQWHTIRNGNLKGRELFLDARDGLWQKEMIDGRYDSYVFDYLNQLDLKGKTVIEIGAQIGLHALYFAARVGDEGTVYAFEPNIFNRERMEIILKKNSELAKRIKLFDVALSDKNGREEFYFCKDVDSGASSGSFISQAHTFYPKSQEYLALFEKASVETVTLDGLSSFLGTDIIPDVIKIDVEGAESSVLEGGLDTLRKHRPLVVVEVHSIYNMLRTSELLHSVRYDLVLLKEERDGRCFIAAEPRTEALPS